MKAILVLCVVVFLTLCGGALSWYLRPDRFGESSAGSSEVSLETLFADPTPYLSKTILLEGVVTRQCALTGCFFFFIVGEKKVRIELSEIAATIPQRRGYRARVEGTLSTHHEELVLLGRSVEFFKR